MTKLQAYIKELLELSLELSNQRKAAPQEQARFHILFLIDYQGHGSLPKSYLISTLEGLKSNPSYDFPFAEEYESLKREGLIIEEDGNVKDPELTTRPKDEEESR